MNIFQRFILLTLLLIIRIQLFLYYNFFNLKSASTESFVFALISIINYY